MSRGVLVGCRQCGVPFHVDTRTFDLAHEVSDGRFRCDDCLEGEFSGKEGGR